MSNAEFNRNQLTFNSITQEYMKCDLFPPERELLVILRDRLNQLDMLDLGVGAGRTSYTFAALVRTYIGIDYAPAMVEMCRSRFGESDRQKFLCLDAADLSKLDDKKFDLVLFSFNGIDCVELEQRHKILKEVHRLLKPDGYFFFSGGSLDAFPWPVQWPRFRFARPLRSMGALAKKTIWNCRRSWANRRQNAEDLKKRGWAYLQNGAHNFSLMLFFSTRGYQIRELTDHGFEIECCFLPDGSRLSPTQPASDVFIYYLCRPTPPSEQPV